MPKIQNKNIGTCICPACDARAHVRRCKDNPKCKLYMVCDNCGRLSFEKNQKFFSGAKCDFVGIKGLEESHPKNLENPRTSSRTEQKNPKVDSRTAQENPKTNSRTDEAQGENLGYNKNTGLLI